MGQTRHTLLRERHARGSGNLIQVLWLKRLGYYNTAVNRLYYACFYAAIALLVAHGHEVKSHAGVRNALSLHYVRTGILPIHYGQLYSLVFAKRTSGDYEDYFTNDLSTVEELQPQVLDFVQRLDALVQQWLSQQTSS